MKVIFLLAAILPFNTMARPASYEGHSLNRRQILKILPQFMVGSWNAANIDNSQKPTIRPDAKRSVIKFGPFKVPPVKDASMVGEHSHGGGKSSSVIGILTEGFFHKDGSFNPQQISDLIQTAGSAIASQGMGGLMSMDPNGISVMKYLKGGFCSNCTILAGTTDIVLSNGEPAGVNRGVYLHHAVTMDLSKPDPGWVGTCPGPVTHSTQEPLLHPFLGGAVDRFIVSYTDKGGKSNSGFQIKQGDDILVQAELVNYKKQEQEVYIRYDIEWLPSTDGPDASLSWLSATGCNPLKMAFKPTGNERTGSLKSQGYPVLKDGTIMMARGHIHDGGTGVKLYLNDKLICDSSATYGGPEGTMNINGKELKTVARMGTCHTPTPVKRGDYLKVESGYDLGEHAARESGGESQEEMGIMYITWAPAKGEY